MKDNVKSFPLTVLDKIQDGATDAELTELFETLEDA